MAGHVAVLGTWGTGVIPASADTILFEAALPSRLPWGHVGVDGEEKKAKKK